MNLTLSYSKARTYMECPKRYDFHYNQGYREKYRSGALFFGTAIDKAVSALLEHIKSGGDPAEFDEKVVFDRWWLEQDVNGTIEHLPGSLRIVYAESDMDWELLSEEDTRFLRAKREELGFGPGDSLPLYEECLKSKAQRAYKKWPEEQQRFYSYANWLSLMRKGHLMLKAHREKVLFKIKKIIHTQLKTELSNGTDSVVGYPDLVCVWEDGKETVIDYKTSSIEYAPDSVDTSAQLASYCYALGIEQAGYVVFRKQIKKNRTKVCSKCAHDGSGTKFKTCNNIVEEKRCGGDWTEAIKPEVVVQIIVKPIPKRTTELVIDNYQDVAHMIKQGVFPRNLSACNNSYGACAFKGLCFRGEDKELEKINGKT